MKPAIKEVPLPKYIAIEGPIGVGKTTLANKIATTFNYDAFSTNHLLVQLRSCFFSSCGLHLRKYSRKKCSQCFPSVFNP